MLLASFLEMPVGPLRQGPLSTPAIVSAILCSFSFEVFVRVSTEVRSLSMPVSSWQQPTLRFSWSSYEQVVGRPPGVTSSAASSIIPSHRRPEEVQGGWLGTVHIAAPEEGLETRRLSPPLSGAEVNIMCHYIRQEV